MRRYGSEFTQMLSVYKKQLRKLKNTFNLPALQKVQQPKAVLITTSQRPKEIRFPGILDIPGSAFVVEIAKNLAAVGNPSIEISPKEIKTALEQAEYPIAHAVENKDKPDLPFSTVNRLIIESPTLAYSKKIADSLVRKVWMREWVGEMNNKIILAAENKGLLNETVWY